MIDMTLLQSLVDSGDIIEFKNELMKNKDWDKSSLGLYLCTEIFTIEVEQNEPTTIFDFSMDLNEIIRHIYHTKLLMRRFEFNLPEELQLEAFDYLIQTGVSDSMIVYLMNQNLFFKKTFALNLAHIAAKICGSNCFRTLLFSKIADGMGD